jgi:phosphate uptake regulator
MNAGPAGAAAANRETRKVQITGKSTYIISLPKKWVTKVKIGTGDTVVLTPRSDGSLLLHPNLTPKSAEGKRLKIDASISQNGDLTRQFIGAYLAGWQQIEVGSKSRLSPEVHEQVRRLCQGVIGPQIIDETPTSVIMKVLLDTGDYTPPQGVKRMHAVVREMLTAVASGSRRDSELPGLVALREEDVDKTYWLIAKQCNLILKDVFYADKLGVLPQQALGFLLVARSLERIGDHAVRIANYSGALRTYPEVSAKVATVTSSVTDILDMSVRSFSHHLFVDANSAIAKSKGHHDEIEGLRHEVLMLRAPPDATMAMAYVVDSLERVLAYATDIAEVAVDQHFIRGLDDGAP